MSNEFRVIQVPEEAAAVEAMGTKFKFWFYDPALGGACLFKKTTPGTGEDWAEKIAAEICELTGLPHADYDLAIWKGKRGCVSRQFLPEGASLLHGNEVLLALVPDYPGATISSRNFYKVSQHQLRLVYGIVSHVMLPLGWTPPCGIRTAGETFVGYLLLDAFIGNTDRHHENWGLILQPGTLNLQEPSIHLAPTFDHSSSLGRNESDVKRRQRLDGKDPRYTVKAYAEKCRSALYDKVGDRKPLTTFQAASAGAKLVSSAAKVWIDAIASVSTSYLQELFARIPGDRISETAIEFAIRLLEFNRERLILLRGNLP